VNEPVWETLYNVVYGIAQSLPVGYFDGVTLPYPGYILRLGSQGDDVKALQEYLNYISDTYTQIPKVVADGIFGKATENAVREYQRIFGLTELGVVPSRTWDSITSTYRDLFDGNQTSEGQYPGYEIGG
jgi:peptidoglycan hydrolase-like protein with peptidoglycan-binding domain